jgi:sigma-B regulation protein RsbU (phosphoserine phosphatase)
MIEAAIPRNEPERLEDLVSLGILDSPDEERFDRITRLASQIFDVPMAAISLVDSNRQWFKSKVGLSVCETGRDISFCGHAILENKPLLIPDAARDARFKDNPLVVSGPRIRFYAGQPIKGPKGMNVGTLCLVDQKPRTLTNSQIGILKELAGAAEREMHLVETIQLQRDLLKTRQALIESQQILAQELQVAARYVYSLLPSWITAGRPRVDWQFLPSSHLGGDAFGYHDLDQDHFAIYLLDVTGHGVGAALLATSILNAVRSASLPNTDFYCPKTVLTALNGYYQMENHDGKCFSMWYGVFNKKTNELTYSSGGHPPAYLMNSKTGHCQELGEGGMVVGMMPNAEFESKIVSVVPGESHLFVYSDGVYEVLDSDNNIQVIDGFKDLIRLHLRSGGKNLEHLIGLIQGLPTKPRFMDDVSIIQVDL